MSQFRVFCWVGLLSLVLIAVALFLRQPVAAQDKPGRPVAKWAYKVLAAKARDDAEEMAEALNRLGEEGWECIGAASRDFGGGGGNRLYFVCKRPKQ